MWLFLAVDNQDPTGEGIQYKQCLPHYTLSICSSVSIQEAKGYVAVIYDSGLAMV